MKEEKMGSFDLVGIKSEQETIGVLNQNIGGRSMKSLILTLLVGTMFLGLPSVGKAIPGDDSLKLYLPFEEGRGKVAKD